MRLGEAWNFESKNDSALYAFHISHKISEEDNFTYGIARALNQIALVQKSRGEYKEALAGFEKSKSIFREIFEEKALATTCSNIGDIFLKLGEYQKALENYYISLNILEKTK